jgi:phage terminase small subunit
VRYFVLKSGVLNYYADKKEHQANAAPKGSFHVLSITSIKTMPQKDKKFQNQCHREIVLPNRSLVVCCDQEDILKKWVDAINAHIRYERKTEHLKKIQIEAQLVEEEMSQQMAFTIMYNVLKRWITVDFTRSLQSWRMNLMVEMYGLGRAESFDAKRLRAQFDVEKKEEMKQFTEAVKAKWEEAVLNLKEEMQSLKDENAKLREENKQFREQVGDSPLPSPPPAGDTVEVLRHEFVALMEAAAMNEVEGSNDESSELRSQVYALEADLKLQTSLAASAQEQAGQHAKRADSLAARLEAAEDALQTMNKELESLRSASQARTSSPPPLPPVPVSPPKVSPRAAGLDGSNWIERYKAIVNSPL